MSSIVPDYSNPPLSKTKSTIFNYQNQTNNQQPTEHFSYLSNQSIINYYPHTANHARHPIIIYCEKCHKLTMTQTQNNFGIASLLWCTCLLPIFCMGLCCICSESCKDIRHICSECRNQVGVSISQVC